MRSAQLRFGTRFEPTSRATAGCRAADRSSQALSRSFPWPYGETCTFRSAHEILGAEIGRSRRLVPESSKRPLLGQVAPPRVRRELGADFLPSCGRDQRILPARLDAPPLGEPHPRETLDAEVTFRQKLLFSDSL